MGDPYTCPAAANRCQDLGGITWPSAGLPRGGAAASPSRDRARRRRPRHALRPELRVGQGLRLRRLAGSPTCWQAATGRGSRAPAASKVSGKAGEGKSRGSPDLRVECVSGSTKEALRKAVCPALWLGCSAPTPSARAASPSVRPAVPARHPGWGPQSPGASSTLPALPPATGLFRAEAPSGCWEEPFRQRRLCVHLGAPRAGRCLPASPERLGGEEPEKHAWVPGERRWDLLKGPLLSRGLGFQDLWFRWMWGLERPGRSGPLPPLT